MAMSQEDVAATKIQATFRGRKARREVTVRRQVSADTPRSRQSREDVAPAPPPPPPEPLAPLPPGRPSTGSALTSEAEEEAQDRKKNEGEAVKTTTTASEKPKFARMKSGISTGGYRTMRQELLEKPTVLPAAVQEVRVTLFLLFEEPASSRGATILSLAILAAILLSIVIFMLETMPELHTPRGPVSEDAWMLMELFCTAVFTVEYVTRLCVCTVNGSTVFKFVRRPMNIVDLSAILPFYVWLAMRKVKITKAFGVLRLVRLVRLFRIFKLNRYSSGLQLMLSALKNSSQALWVLSFFLSIGIVLFSSLLYYVEKVSCPDRDMLQSSEPTITDQGFTTLMDQYNAECHNKDRRAANFVICCDENDSPMNFPTIIEAFWWSIVTMTTVGFGDIVPSTTMGKVVGTTTMLSGILLVALPIAIIGRKFQEAYDEHLVEQGDEERQREKERRSMEPEATLSDMGRRLRRMRFPDSHLSTLARDLADELEEASAMQKEIMSMQAFEKNKQKTLTENFGKVFDSFIECCNQVKAPGGEDLRRMSCPEPEPVPSGSPKAASQPRRMSAPSDTTGSRQNSTEMRGSSQVVAGG